MRTVRRTGATLLFLAFLSGAPFWAAVSGASMAPAQPDAPRPAGLHATLYGWADHTWMRILDRDGAAEGRLSARGILQRFHRTTDDEYRLDLVSRSFGLVGDHTWYRDTERGIRYAVGSVNPRDLAESLELVVPIPFGSGWSFDVRLDREVSPEVDRTLFRVAIRRAFPSGLFGVAEGSLGAVKPSSDLELGGGWVAPDGRASVFLSGGVLDAFNDVIYGSIEVHPNFADTALSYERQPLTLRGEGTLRLGGRMCIELFGARMRDATVRAFRQREPDQGFRQRESFGYAGVLVEAVLHPSVSAGVTATHVRSEIDRVPLAGGSPDDALRVRERETRVGAYAIARLHRRWLAEAEIVREIRPERREVDAGSSLDPMDYEDRAFVGSLSLTYGRAAGFTSVVAIDGDARRVERGDGQLPTRFGSLGHDNIRLRIDLGWSFPGRGVLYLGAGADLDGDSHSDPQVFDGGRARFVVAF